MPATRMYTTKEEVLHRAQELVDARKTFGELDSSGRINGRNKGNLGQIIEENWYGYTPNSDKDPDFAEAGVELKVSPYKETTHGISAKERLVCDIINYMEEANKTFETSAFWHKCKCICLLSYKWSPGISKSDMFVDHATLLNEYPEEDLLIIKQDWEIIIEKIRNGQAHLLAEGDTNYLGACTKGASAETVRDQPYSTTKAKQRAYSLKTKYMTRILRKFVFGEEEDEHVIRDWHVLAERRFDDVVLDMFDSYIGKSSEELAFSFGIPREKMTIKSFHALITRRILGIVGNPDAAAEFKNANISVKTMVINTEHMPEEDLSFPTFKFSDILEQDWEDSDVYEQMAAARFLFVVFKRYDKDMPPVLTKAFFWNMPVDDIDELKRVWERTKDAIRQNACLRYNGRVVKNSLPKSSESYVAHVRPHATGIGYMFSDGTVKGDPEKYGNPLPDGQWMTTQSFWFNKSYIKNVIMHNMNEE